MGLQAYEDIQFMYALLYSYFLLKNLKLTICTSLNTIERPKTYIKHWFNDCSEIIDIDFVATVSLIL